MLAYAFGALVIFVTFMNWRKTPDHEAAVKVLWRFGIYVGIGILVMNYFFIQFLPG